VKLPEAEDRVKLPEAEDRVKVPEAKVPEEAGLVEVADLDHVLYPGLPEVLS
jgi:hypothetical protein